MTRQEEPRNVLTVEQLQQERPDYQILIQNVEEAAIKAASLPVINFHDEKGNNLGFIFNLEELKILVGHLKAEIGEIVPTQYNSLMRATIATEKPKNPQKPKNKAKEQPAWWGLVGKRTGTPSWGISSQPLSPINSILEQHILPYLPHEAIKINYGNEYVGIQDYTNSNFMHLWIYAAPSDSYYNRCRTTQQYKIDLSTEDSTQGYSYNIHSDYANRAKQRRDKDLNNSTLILDETKQKIAEYFPNENCFFIFCDLFRGDHMIYENRMTIFGNIISEWKGIILQEYSDKTIENFQVSLKEMLFNKRVDNLFDVNITKIQKELEGAKRQIKTSQETLTRYHLHKINNDAMLSGLMSSKANIIAKIEEELIAIETLDQVVSVELTGTIIAITTRNLLCWDELYELYRDMGKYKIQILLDTSEAKWFNLTRKVDGSSEAMNHPHIDRTGTACEGNLTKSLQASIMNFEYYSAITLAIAFVESANVADSYGKHITQWPKATEEAIKERGFDTKG